MGILDYIRSRMEDGDPEFDLDWEIAREMANDCAEARFAAKKPTLSASVGKANIALAQGRTGESVASGKSISQSAASSQVKPGDYQGSDRIAAVQMKITELMLKECKMLRIVF